MEFENKYILKINYVLEREVRCTVIGEEEFVCRLPREIFPKELKRGEIFYYRNYIILERMHDMK